MTYSTIQRDDGHLVHRLDGRAVCNVITTDVEQDVGIDAKTKQPCTVYKKTPRPKDKWEIHFCGGIKFAPGDLTELLQYIAKLTT